MIDAADETEPSRCSGGAKRRTASENTRILVIER